MSNDPRVIQQMEALISNGDLIAFCDYFESLRPSTQYHRYQATSRAIVHGRLEILQCLEPDNSAAHDEWDWGRAYGDSVAIACELGYLEVVKYMCENGALGRSESIEYSSSIIAACEYGHLQIAKYLHKHTEEDIRCNGDCALQLATENGHVEVVRYILQVIDTDQDVISAARELVRKAETQD